MEMSVRPTAARPARYSAKDSAPAMQPLKRAPLGAFPGAQRIVGDDVADADPAARHENPGDLREHRAPCPRRD